MTHKAHCPCRECTKGRVISRREKWHQMAKEMRKEPTKSEIQIALDRVEIESSDNGLDLITPVQEKKGGEG